MKFGPVPLADAKDAILAHSEGGVAKGTVLTAAHLETLAGRGLRRLTVARLEPGDVHEDTAARRLADVVPAGAGLEAGPAATGRVNLRAKVPGIVQIDAAAIHAANRISPAITIATVAEWTRLEPRGLAATIKIIPYALPEADLALACAAAAGAMRLRTPVFDTVTLIETVTDGKTPPDKGRRSTATRLARLGLSLTDRVVVAHEEEAIAQALQDAPGAVLLVLTGSATSDSADTAPQGLRRAGGRVAHFGMPVDPGNLLFVGDLRQKPVIGLPGCARSPALNGADWVLERVLCDVPVGPAEIAAMGVGGLLKEIPSRPRPRAG